MNGAAHAAAGDAFTRRDAPDTRAIDARNALPHKKKNEIPRGAPCNVALSRQPAKFKKT
ncbi:hypothetical protein [Burkholderia pseudomallei]|uniref:hypothetical protein n=1 Tax=Burkholderia pseudomallei TaxID=28450 RepID=UPI00040CD38E|nr:hypothetical protein [Burkholderia pseudomallei]ONC37876.1 hypothetical protein AQ915_05415 [Burkholderia pseudomallei]ONC43460.1 hypothetical protein AQ916_28670 [Burkholderia pseudomallei]